MPTFSIAFIAWLAVGLSQASQLPKGHPEIAPTAHATPSGPTSDDFEPPKAGPLPPGHPDTAGEPGPSQKELLEKLDQMKADLKSRPKTAEIEFALGNLYYENSRWPDAIDAYRQLLDRAEAPLARYLALRRKPHKTITAEAAHCAAGDERVTFDGLIRAADAKADRGDVSAAIACYESAILPMAVAYTRRGNAWYLIGNDDKAVADHEKTLTFLDDYPDSLFFLGAILFEGGDGDLPRLRKAKAYWQRFLRVNQDPERQKLVTKDIQRLQLAIDNRGHLPKEMPPEMRAMALGPIEPPAPPPVLSKAQKDAIATAVAEGRAASSAKRWKDALAAFDRARALDKADPDAATGAGIALLNLGRTLEAEAALRDALGRNPENALAAYELGEVFFKNEHYAGAAKFWAQVLEEDPELGATLKVKDRLAKAQQAQ